MNKKLTYAGIAAVLLLVIAGCGDKPAAAPAEGAGQGSTVANGAGGAYGSNAGGEDAAATATAQPTTEPATASPAATEQPAAPDKQTQNISVYFTDPQQMELVPAKASISFADEAEKYSEAYKALQSSGNADQIPLWAKIELISLEFAGGQITMDIHKPDEAQLGAGGEAFAINALAKTLFQFEEVKSIEVLVDGEQVESLMGHVDLEHPMTRENSGL
ncbi:GerMN domain-containing protein [Paenibacillus sp. S150]|uniref:GerMN domain-containing protein n=1 Tax=Paenibacillus sp. S150 TaxID=2749826 RepID=UPI001C584836|nr:GerMN domain-containing protein [Paenibacillus sp. S150]MBW4085608.1 GerMN domain-containing protein [Paenibacillus sp. S150]